MTGSELIRQMSKQRPDVKVILISGYAENTKSWLELDLTTPFLQKPFTSERLIALVREVLNGVAAGCRTGAGIRCGRVGLTEQRRG